MIDFWFAASLLLVLASLFLLVPAFQLVFKGQNKSLESVSSREEENVSLFKERLNELNAEAAEGKISDQNYQDRKQELEFALLNDVDPKKTSSNDSTENNKPFAYIIVCLSIVFIAITSIWMYQVNGSKGLVDEYYAMNFNAKELDQAKELAKNGDMSALLNQLHGKLKSSPNNLEGWQLLASSSMNSQRYSLAIEAYEQIIRIYQMQNADPSPIYGLLAQAQYYQAEGKLSAEVNETIQKALALDSNELNSLGLLAIHAFSNQSYLDAKNYWLRILAVYPEHPARASMEAGIQRVNSQLGLIDEEIISPNNSQQAWVSVSVSIDESASQMFEPSDTVFIIAKNIDQTSGPNVPLAVSRHRVDELPIIVKLDDTKSMAPIAKISMANNVVVIARISKTGNPIAQSGDYEAVSADIKPKNQESIELIIQNAIE